MVKFALKLVFFFYKLAERIAKTAVHNFVIYFEWVLKSDHRNPDDR